MSAALAVCSKTSGAFAASSSSVSADTDGSVTDDIGRRNALADHFLADPLYPGTAVARLRNIHARVATLTPRQLSGDWVDVRRRLLWAGGLADNDELSGVAPGDGYTGHAFNDANHFQTYHNTNKSANI